LFVDLSDYTISSRHSGLPSAGAAAEARFAVAFVAALVDGEPVEG